jgi:SagB-type dehydrogenase family enzyme
MRNCLPAVLLMPALGVAADVKPLELPAPQLDGGKPLMQALKARQSVREFRDCMLPLQVLSNLLWAAAGINRSDGRRTVPSGMNIQEVEVYVITADGLYRYDPKGHNLTALRSGNLRPLTGDQEYVATPPVHLVYVADFAKYTALFPAEDRLMYAGTDAGFISQNVYLFCASEGLATVVRGSMNRTVLAKAMGLRPEQRIILDQPVGYPK